MPRHFALIALVFLALGCGRTQVNPAPEPAAVIADPVPPPPDDGSIPPPHPVRVRPRMETLALGVDYLLAQQSKDGVWRSDVYATFKDGTALTPLAVTALQEAHDAGIRNPAIETAIKKGCEYLAQFVKDGTVAPPTDGFDYPIYTAALALKAFSHPTAPDFAKHRSAWVKDLKDRQLTEKLGWKPEEKQYGGWGYCRVIPKKPEPNTFAPNLIESNLSATVFALDALRTAGETDAEMYKAAAIFVRRCQNWNPPPEGKPAPPWQRFFDGGFFFIYDDPVRNKAGQLDVAPPVVDNKTHYLMFPSYGSTSADGFRALALCNDPADKERIESARRWLLTNFRADHHPGRYIKAHEPNRDAVYYYYAASAARAFHDSKLELPEGRDWSAEWSYELAKRQAKDGSWENPVELVRENDPLVATSNAVLALARCRK
jgi:hypothetical protein